MDKETLTILVTEMYDNLLNNIHKQNILDNEDVVEYLRESIDVFSHISSSELSSIEHAKESFNDAYREIANKSIASYKHTNQKFEELTQQQEATILDCETSAIDIEEITIKFNEIKGYMVDEVKKANEIISKLSMQVKGLEKDSNLDSLTKVFNRRALSSYLNNLCGQNELNYELHLLILDIDDFKIINDTYGHIAGDKILIFIANILRKTLRDGDKIFRYGGEEFILILNRIDIEHCKKIALRILDIISSNNLIYKGKSLGVTVSMGTTILDINDTPDELIERADKALYKAKKDGKNTIRTELVNGS